MIDLTVNGQKHQVEAPADKPLLWVLREDLNPRRHEVRLRRRSMWSLHRPYQRHAGAILLAARERGGGQDYCHH
jgi:hypothetical protein